MLPHLAATLEEQQMQQQQLLVLLSTSARPLASIWPPPNSSAPVVSPLELSPAAGEVEPSQGAGGGDGRNSGPGVELSPWEVVLCATGAAVAAENALVLAALLVAGGLRAPVFLLIGSLALADLLAGLGLLVNFAVRHLLPPPPSETAALGAAGLLLMAFSASLGSLLAITLDLYFSLCQALTYPAERPQCTTAALLALMWLLCVALGLLPLLGWNCLHPPTTCSALRPITREQAALLAAALLLTFALRLQLDLRICKIAAHHSQQIAIQCQFHAAAPPQASSVSHKGLATLALILGTFALCWVPLAIYLLVADDSFPATYTYSLALPAACNSLINPVFYAFRHPDIQKTLQLACCGCLPTSFSRTRTASDV